LLSYEKILKDRFFCFPNNRKCHPNSFSWKFLKRPFLLNLLKAAIFPSNSPVSLTIVSRKFFDLSDNVQHRMKSVASVHLLRGSKQDWDISMVLFFMFFQKSIVCTSFPFFSKCQRSQAIEAFGNFDVQCHESIFQKRHSHWWQGNQRSANFLLRARGLDYGLTWFCKLFLVLLQWLHRHVKCV
jgi:hypothetical protein